MQVHPAAELFPMLDDADLGMLADDIRKNGLIEPIIMHRGQVLDGRNRLAACKRAGVDPQFIEMDEVASPVMYVISRNLHRRHLSVSQRAAIGAEMMPLLQEEAQQRQRATQLRGRDSEGNPVRSSPNGHDRKDEEQGPARTIAAKAVGVGEVTVQRALKAKRENPEGFEKVKRGELTVCAAAQGLTEQPQHGGHIAPSTMANGDRKQQLAESQKRRMVGALSTANGICVGLEEADVAAIVSVCEAKEIRDWAEKSRELANKLRNFAKRLEKGE